MRVKLDENLPRAARDRLLTFAWDVHDVYDEGLESAVDTQIQRDQSIGAVLQCLDAAIRALETQRIQGSLWIVEPQRLRIRDHPTGA